MESSTPTLTGTRFYRPELDALRFFAFAAVFVYHFLPHSTEFFLRNLPGDFLAHVARHAVMATRDGVMLFFMLSSFLITTLLIREQDLTGQIKLGAFYVRRLLRIWPLYFFFAALCLWVLPLWGRIPLGQFQLFGLLTFSANWTMLFEHATPNPAAPLWSVSVEEQFYLVWPLVMMWTGVSRLKVVAIIGIAIACAYRIIVLFRGGSDRELWFSTFTHLDSIAAGALLAHLFKAGLPRLSPMTRWTFLATGLILPVIVRSLPGEKMEIFIYPITTIGCALILVSVLGINQALAFRPLVYLGKISYGLYVFHLTAIWAAREMVGGWTAAPVALALTLSAAAISYHWIELPFLRLKKRFTVVESRSP